MTADVTFPGAFLAGLISFLSPCVLPLVPPYLCFLGGTTLDQLTRDGETTPDVQRRVFLSALMFVAGFTTVFVTLGATASYLGRLVAEHQFLLAQIAGAAIIVLGLHFLGLVRIPILYREARYHAEARTAGLVGPYVVGLAFAFGWTPCIGPVLAAILFVAAGQDTVSTGMALLAVYSLGIGVPFLAASLAVRPFLNFMGRFRRQLGTVEKAMGGLLVLTGLMFLTGTFNDMSYWLLETFPGLANLEGLALGGVPGGG